MEPPSRITVPAGTVSSAVMAAPTDALPECLCACRVNEFRPKAVSSVTMCCNNPNAEHHKHDKAEAKKLAPKKTSQGGSRS